MGDYVKKALLFEYYIYSHLNLTHIKTRIQRNIYSTQNKLKGIHEEKKNKM